RRTQSGRKGSGRHGGFQMDQVSTDRATRPAISRRGLLGVGAGLIAVAAAPGLAHAAAAEAAAPASVDAVAGRMLADKVWRGLTVAIFRKGGFSFSRGYGFANLETATLMSPKSVLHIGSISKQFTAAALMKLHEQGKFDLDDRFSRHYPDF